MSIEAGVVIDHTGTPIYWHLPKGRTGGALPDSEKLWNVIWEFRECISCIAHTHPGSGYSIPSAEDFTTFSAIELALGRRLGWFIVTSDTVVLATWAGPDKYQYKLIKVYHTPSWTHHLRRISKF